MGNTKSTTYADTAVSLCVKVITEFTQQCQASISQGIAWDIQAKGDIKISDVDLSQYAVLNDDCIQNATAETDLESKLTSAMQQQAEATSQALSLQLGSTEANTILKSHLALAQAVTTAFRQQCAPSISQSVSLTLKAAGGVELKAFKVGQVANLVSQCQQTSAAVTKAKADLTSTVDQSAKSKQESLFEGLALLILAVVAGLGVFLIAGKQALPSAKTALGVAAAVGVGLGGYFLYTRSSSSTPPPS